MQKVMKLNTKTDLLEDLDLESLEKVVNILTKKVKKLVDKNGFSKALKEKAQKEL